MIRLIAPFALLLLLPAALLWDRTPPPAVRRPVVRVVAAVPPGRRLFGDGLDDPSIDEVEAGSEAGVPILVGVAGRLPDAAVAMVQGTDGRSRPVAVGATVDGWRLEGLAADQAVFSDRGRRVRVRMPPPDQ